MHYLQPGVAGERAEAVGQDAPAIEWKAMLVPCRGSNDATQASWL